MKAENRHYSSIWKKRRKEHKAAKCKTAKCIVCHPEKVSNKPTRQEIKATIAV
jgi:hypothetical protein